MQLKGKVVVVTGAASGIGRAGGRRFAAEKPKGIVVADLNAEGTVAVAEELTNGGASAIAVSANVAEEADVQAVVAKAAETFGPVDLFFSNAGIGTGGSVDATDEAWQMTWDVNLMAHVYAARACLPHMLERGDGYLCSTASAAGLLTNLGAAPYAVTKHAAVALAEWLAITYGDAGIKVSCLCPQGVRTPMLLGGIGQDAGDAVLASGGMLEPEEVADVVVQAIGDERFLILPHPEVAKYMERRATDHERWLTGMRRLQARVAGGQTQS
jgi:NAD(P)-dependent dehydrogenase (short-subunit alcohol dehydrogenase family)